MRLRNDFMTSIRHRICVLLRGPLVQFPLNVTTMRASTPILQIEMLHHCERQHQLATVELSRHPKLTPRLEQMPRQLPGAD
jgi:hypothetical protein